MMPDTMSQFIYVDCDFLYARGYAIFLLLNHRCIWAVLASKGNSKLNFRYRLQKSKNELILQMFSTYFIIHLEHFRDK